MTQPYRPLALFAALLGGFGLALQLWFSIRMTEANGGTVLAGVWLFLGFYTILSNLLVVGVLSAAATGSRGPLGIFLTRPSVQTAAAMSIVIVSAIYNVMLRQLWSPSGWLLVADVIVHDAMPLLYLVYWWLAVPKGALRWSQALVWQSYPAGYFLYVLLRGAANGWYPYPFLDVRALGYLQVLLDAIGVLAAFIVVALLLVALGRWQARRRAPAVADIA
ncbi:Pr6Pr family membrane protein [Dyella kyungheensis]|uniref:Pr6Pr family membrane protein n=1 Tax=Dyella kyungheensis TaxID=1242174 RepID=A0ABS2JYM6_9GAMM|nr:Pr6Pr family membrane protein [Dyella kyungheensis]MBM7123445.1 Pr6Pr family membrane protein [Dyella kyungheensis]